MFKSILFIAAFAFISNCYSQLEYINLDRSSVANTLRGKAKRHKLRILIKQTDSTIVCATRDTNVRHVVIIVYFDNRGISNKVLEAYEVDSCRQIAFNNILSAKRFKWTKIMNGTYLSKFSKKLLLFENPQLPFSYILQHNKYMTHKEYDALMPTVVP